MNKKTAEKIDLRLFKREKSQKDKPNLSKEPQVLPQKEAKKTRFFYVFLFLLTFGLTFAVCSLILKDQPKTRFPGVLSKPNSQLFRGDYQNSYEAHSLLYQIKTHNTNLLLVDLRSETEYQRGHIKSAVNVPAYQKLTSDSELNLNEDNFIQGVINLAKRKRLVVIYGHSAYSIIPKYLVEGLNQRGIKAFMLSVGWNEWRHFHNFWIPEGEWNKININDFIVIQDS